jgi:hypothetical protein
MGFVLTPFPILHSGKAIHTDVMPIDRFGTYFDKYGKRNVDLVLTEASRGQWK